MGGAADFVMNIMPKTIVGSFAESSVLQIIFFAPSINAAGVDAVCSMVPTEEGTLPKE